VAMLELKTLRAQMNPHFIFNSMNSIKSFIAQNEPRTATRYLTKFSHLMRLILNNSNLAKVALEDELKGLELYIELEQLRYQDGFEYEIEIAPNVQLDHISVPSMIVQPYVENAIWHGLLHKEGVRNLVVSFAVEGSYLNISVRDNGIGREAAKAIKSKSATKHKSMGMDITASRIALTNANEAEKSTQIKIVDLLGPSGEALGTEVKMKIRIDQ